MQSTRIQITPPTPHCKDCGEECLILNLPDDFGPSYYSLCCEALVVDWKGKPIPYFTLAYLHRNQIQDSRDTYYE